MTTQIIVKLDNKEIERIADIQDLITVMYNELVIVETPNQKELDLLTQTKDNLDEIVYQFCNDKYRAIHY